MASLPRAPGADDGADHAEKIAIPRLEGRHEKRQEKPRPPKPRKSRTQRACDNCRRRKVRCTGEPSQCRNCAEQGATCVYSMARRDRFKEATQKNVELVALLRGLSLHVDEEGASMIERHLESLGDQTISNPPPDSLGKRSRDSTPSEGASDASDDSDSEPDAVDEDILHDRESRATGFVGSNSSIQWLRSLKGRMGSAGLGHPSSRSPYSGKHTFQHGTHLRVSNSTFYLDDDDLEADVMVDPYHLPPPDMAEELFNYYISTVHDSFPIVPDVFTDQFRKWNGSRRHGRNYQVPEEWQAMLNLVMAIGAQYARLTQSAVPGDEREDILYMTRACRILRLDRLATSLPAPSLSFIQSVGLLSLYYLTIGQVSRAWMMVGISLRFALAAGLHLRNDDPSAMLEKKETLVRTWWSLHSIESLLCAIIGRPCIIPNDECTVPLPQVSPRTSQSEGSTHSSGRGDSGSVTRSSFLGARITIALILQKALAKLYSPQLSIDSWDRIQTDITNLLREIEDWATGARLAGLSPATEFEPAAVERAKLILGFHYQSAKLLICRPCLTRIERRNKAQSDTSAEFYQRTADMCVTSAQAIARLLPDAIDLRFIYEQSPWWCIVHNIMQALAVFLLKLSLGTGHDFHDGEELANNVRKLIRWLHAMSASNTVADRACQVAIDIIRASSPRIRIDISDIVSAQPGKPGRRGSRPASQSNRPTTSISGPSGQVRQHKIQSLSGPLGTQSHLPPTITPQNMYPTAPSTRSPTATLTSSQDAFLAGASSSMAPHAHFPTPQADEPQPLGQQALSIPTQQELSQQNLMSQADLTAAQFGPRPELTMQPGFDIFPFHSDFSLDAGMPMPTIFGNPFSTNFDQVNPIGGFSGGGTNVSQGMESGAGFGPAFGGGGGALGDLGGSGEGQRSQGGSADGDFSQMGGGGEFR